MAEPWLDPEEQRCWRAFVLGTRLLFDQLDDELQQAHGLSLYEYEVLVRLSEHPERRLRMAVLAQALAHSRSRTTHTIKRMEEAGLVCRGADPSDRRGVVAELTATGMRTLEAAAYTHVRGVRRHFVEVAGPDDLEVLGRVFDDVGDPLMDAAPADVITKRRASAD